MIKPVWAAVGGLAVLGTGGGMGVLFASTGGEEEAGQDYNSAPVKTCIPIAGGPPACISPDEYAQACSDLPCGPPTPDYTCIYKVVDGEAPCLPLTDPRVSDVEACHPIVYKGRAACTPPQATLLLSTGGVRVEGSTPNDLYPDGGWWYLGRGSSVVRWANSLLEYRIGAEDEADFKAMEALFKGEQ